MGLAATRAAAAAVSRRRVSSSRMHTLLPLALVALPLLLLLILPTTIGAEPAVLVPSVEKANTFLRRCPPPPQSPDTHHDLFPLDIDPMEWPTCEDAYAPTWYDDPTGALPPGLLTATELHKLARSMGFCPHRRCQLGDVGNSATPGRCPPGLCYTKLEQGAPSFGACCFDEDGVFNAGQLIGYYDLLRATPKPIYKRGRVVLGGDPSDESREGFINANEVLPGLILTQCPVTEYSPGATPTLGAFTQMLREQEVGLVLQLDPHAQNPAMEDEDEEEALGRLLATVSKRGCGVWPTDAAHPDVGLVAWEAEGRLVSFDYTVGDGLSVRHHWYYGWRDFAVPTGEGDDGVVLELAKEAVGFIRAGRKVVVACHSGRGRSGTLAAIIGGLLHDVGTVAEAVDQIVRMREARDGLVETPAQFAYVSRLLRLRPSANTSPPSSSLFLLWDDISEWAAALSTKVRAPAGLAALEALPARLREYERHLPTALALLGSLALLILFLRGRRRQRHQGQQAQAQPPKPQRKSTQSQPPQATAFSAADADAAEPGGGAVEGVQERASASVSAPGAKRRGLRRRVGDWGRRMLGLPPKKVKEG